MDNNLHKLDEHLQKAYKNARYEVYKPPLSFSIGQKHPEMDKALLQLYSDYQNWAFITAFNPASVSQSATFNTRNQKELLKLIRKKGYNYLEGEGGSHDDSWPPEKSILIINIAEKEALALARQFGQKAIVFGKKGGKAQLKAC